MQSLLAAMQHEKILINVHVRVLNLEFLTQWPSACFEKTIMKILFKFEMAQSTFMTIICSSKTFACESVLMKTFSFNK